MTENVAMLLASAVRAGDGVRSRRALATVGPDRDEQDQVYRVLANAASGGSDLAVQLLVEQLDHSGLTRAAAARFLVDEDAVQEVAQDVLLSVAGSVDGYDGRSRFSTWVFTIARHRAADHLRRQRSHAPEDEPPTQTMRISSMIASRAAVDQMLARLPDDYRHAVALRDVEQLPYDDVARRLGCNPSTARTRVARGRALVARMLGDEVAS